MAESLIKTSDFCDYCDNLLRRVVLLNGIFYVCFRCMKQYTPQNADFLILDDILDSASRKRFLNILFTSRMHGTLLQHDVCSKCSWGFKACVRDPNTGRLYKFCERCHESQ